MRTYGIGQKEEIQITREEANFDRACDAAYQRALMKFDPEESGKVITVPEFDNKTDFIQVEFKRYVRAGIFHHYIFDISVERVIFTESNVNDGIERVLNIHWEEGGDDER